MDFGRDLEFRRGEAACFRVSFVYDSEADEFAELLSRRLGETVRLGRAQFKLHKILTPGEHPLAVSFPLRHSGLFQTSDITGFRFISPTGFKRDGKQFFLPLPELVFGDLLRKWARFAGEPPVAEPENLISRMEITRYNLRSHAAKLRNDRIFRGFCGEVEYSANRLTEDERAFISALASMAYFTGVGYKTTQGLGEVLPFQRE
jgi:CRISPR-associated endoribonuclease Cas6